MKIRTMRARHQKKRKDTLQRCGLGSGHRYPGETFSFTVLGLQSRTTMEHRTGTCSFFMLWTLSKRSRRAYATMHFKLQDMNAEQCATA